GARGGGGGGAGGWGGAQRRDVGGDRPSRGAGTGPAKGGAGDAAIRELPWVGETGAGRTGVFAGGALDGPLIAVFPAEPDGLRTLPTRTELLSALNSIVYSVRQRLERGRLEDLVEQARAIQLSLLPNGRRDCAGVDLVAC